MKIIKNLFNWIFLGTSGKTSWEWLELLVVPIGLAVGAFYLDSQVERRQERITQERYEQELRIADDQSKQKLLASYFVQMQELLLEKDLRNSSSESEVRSVARAITATTIKELDSTQNALLISFLKESDLISSVGKNKRKTLPLLVGMKLNKTDLRDVDLRDVDLRDVDLSDSDLSGANLEKADLTGANLRAAALNSTNLKNTDLREAFPEIYSLNDIDVKDDSSNKVRIDNEEVLESMHTLVQVFIEQAYLCETKLPERIDLDPDRDCDWLSLYNGLLNVQDEP